MSNTSNTMRGLKFQGDVYVRNFGTEDEWQHIGNAKELKLGISSESDDLIGTGKFNAGQAVDTDVTANPTQLNVSWNTFNRKNFAMAHMGKDYDLDTNKVTKVDEAFKVTKLDEWLSLPDENVDKTSLSATLSGSGIDDALIEVKERLGFIKIKSGGTVSAGDDILISYETIGDAGYGFDAGTLVRNDFEMKLDGKNKITNKDGLLNIWHAVLSPKGEFDFFSKGWMEAGMQGTCLTSKEQPYPYRFREFEGIRI